MEGKINSPETAQLVGFSVPFARAYIFEAGPNGKLLRSIVADENGKFPGGAAIYAKERIEIIYPSEGTER